MTLGESYDDLFETISVGGQPFGSAVWTFIPDERDQRTQ